MSHHNTKAQEENIYLEKFKLWLGFPTDFDIEYILCVGTPIFWEFF